MTHLVRASYRPATSNQAHLWKVSLGFPPLRAVSALPDDGDKLGHGELMRNQELGFVQRRQVPFLVVPLNDDLQGAVSR